MADEIGECRSVFPAPVYRETVLERIFEAAKRYFLGPLLEIEYAHTLMLERQGILSRAHAVACINALNGLDLADLRRAEYDGRCEDLFFLVEQRLAAACGADVAGRMHTARSRNDIDLTMYRMVLRERLRDVLQSVVVLRARLVSLAEKHRDDLMPAYTHNQPAQPTTLGHYLMAMAEVLERDSERLISAYGRLNRSPMGACAITTTGFPIDREFTARMLGFSGVQVNSYGAIAAVDYLAESCSVLAVVMLSLGRFAQDLLLWSTAEFGFLRLSDAYVQVSSIMPQKRNPVPLEHVRALASRSMTSAQSVVGCLHNTPFADMNDSEDDLQPLVYEAFEDGERSLRLLAGVLGEAEFKTERMAAAAERNFLSVTELADTLVRRAGMSFGAAHELVSHAVKEMTAAGESSDAGEMARIVERELRGRSALRDGEFSGELLSVGEIVRSLSPRNFVEVRSVIGGPAARALEPEIRRACEQIGVDRRWLRDTGEDLRRARAELHVLCAELAGSLDAG